MSTLSLTFGGILALAELASEKFAVFPNRIPVHFSEISYTQFCFWRSCRLFRSPPNYLVVGKDTYFSSTTPRTFGAAGKIGSSATHKTGGGRKIALIAFHVNEGLRWVESYSGASFRQPRVPRGVSEIVTRNPFMDPVGTIPVRL